MEITLLEHDLARIRMVFTCPHPRNDMWPRWWVVVGVDNRWFYSGYFQNALDQFTKGKADTTLPRAAWGDGVVCHYNRDVDSIDALKDLIKENANEQVS